MEEKIVILVPKESEEFQKQRSDFKWNLDLEVFSKFWGLYVMRLPIPEDIWNYVYNNKESLPNPEIKMAFSILSGAPIEQDSTVRKMIFMEIK